MSDRMNRDFRMPEKGDFKLPVDGDFKGDGRSGRLAKHKAVYKRMEDEFRKELMYDARQACKAQVAAFGECAKEQSLMVVFKCRDQNAKMMKCIDDVYNEDKFTKYVEAKGYFYTPSVGVYEK